MEICTTDKAPVRHDKSVGGIDTDASDHQSDVKLNVVQLRVNILNEKLTSTLYILKVTCYFIVIG